MRILQDINMAYRLPGIEAIDTRSAWSFFRKRPGGGYYSDLIDFETVIRRDEQQPPESSQIMLNIEFNDEVSYAESLWQILPVVAYYKAKHPVHRVGIWRHVPAYYPSNDGHPLQSAILGLVDFVTVRGYMPSPVTWDDWLFTMTEYLSRAKQTGRPIYFYFAPHYVGTKEPIEIGKIWQVLEFCEHVWPVDTFVIWTDSKVPSDVDPAAAWREVFTEEPAETIETPGGI